MKEFKYCPICKERMVKRKIDGHVRHVCANCKWVHYLNPLPSVAALVRNTDGHILLVKRGVQPGKGAWSLPTGFIEQDEAPEAAVVRELFEETSLRGNVKRLIGVYREYTSIYGSILLVGYELDYAGGSPRAGSDTIQARFFSAHTLPTIPFRSHRAVIRDSTVKAHASGPFITVLKSKITEATITHTQLFYKGSMGIDGSIMKKAGIIPGEKVQVLNYSNGERLETYTIEEKTRSGRIVLYGPAAHKGNKGDKLCILSYASVHVNAARDIIPCIIILDERNRIKRRLT